MKNFKKWLTAFSIGAAAILLLPSLAHATPVSWDFASNVLQPLQSGWSALVKADHFQATSTTAASIFPYASTTAVSATTVCISTDCRTVWPVSGGTVNTGLTGQNAYYAANGTAVSATSTIFISTASKVGIGTTTPQSELTIQQSANTTLGGITLYNAAGTAKGTINVGATGGFAFNSDADSFAFNTNGVNFTMNTGAFLTSDNVRALGGAANRWISLFVAGTVRLGSGTTGSALADSGGVLTINGGTTGTGVINLNGTGTGFVGIGTTTPLSRLAVGGNASIGADYNIAAPTNGLLVEGNVGIGTTSPYQKFSVAGNEVVTGSVAWPSITGTQCIHTVNGIVSGTGSDCGSGGGGTGVGTIATSTSEVAGEIPFFTSTAGYPATLGGNTGFVFNGTNVGIGTTSPESTLTVTSSGATAATFYRAASLNTAVEFRNLVGSAFAGITTTGNFGIGFSNSLASAPFQVAATGNVGVGSSTPSARLSVRGVGNSTGVSFQTTNSSDVPRFTILDNGNVGVGTVSPTAPLYVEGALGGAVLDLDTSAVNTNYLPMMVAGSTRWALAKNGTNLLELTSDTTGRFFNFRNFGGIGINNGGSISAQLTIGTPGTTAGNMSLAGATSGTVTIGVPAVAGTTTFNFPNTNGTNTYVLQTDGSGNTSWVPPSGGSGTVGSGTIGQLPYYAANGTTLTATSSIFFATNGSVGIGTQSPTAQLHISNAAAAASLSLTGTGAITSSFNLGDTADVNNFSIWRIIGSSGANTNFKNIPDTFALQANNANGLILATNAASPAPIIFSIGTAFTNEAMRVASNGFIGIGTTTPGSALSIQGNIFLAGNIVATSTASSTFAGPIVSPCFANTVAGPCLTSGAAIGGLNTQLLYNNVGTIAGISGATTNGTAVSLTGAHLLNPTINGAGTGLATLAYPNTSSSATLTLPTTTDTLVGQATTDTLTNKTLTAPVITGATITTSTLNGVTLTTGGSANSYLNGAGSYTAITSGQVTTALGFTPISGNQTITLSGDVSGSGTTAITTTIGALKVLGSMIAAATIDLTTKVTGILPIANGGTNAASFATTGNSLYWDGTRLATALLTAAVTTPYASSTAMTSGYASSTRAFFGSLFVPSLGIPAGSFLAVNTTGQIIATTSPSGATPINYQVFTTTGTWTKPAACVTGNEEVYIQSWGAGGNGGSAGAGGGGAYNELHIACSALTGTVTVTVGSGAGANTTFGSFLTAFGGGTGGGTQGGGGGGTISGGSGTAGGRPAGGIGGASGTSSSFGGGGGATNTGGDSGWGGGGGGGGGATTGGSSMYGGGGGYGNSAGGTVGTSIYGGNGGGNGGSGVAPGGGGGGGSGSGARGEVRVWVTSS